MNDIKTVAAFVAEMDKQLRDIVTNPKMLWETHLSNISLIGVMKIVCLEALTISGLWSTLCLVRE